MDHNHPRASRIAFLLTTILITLFLASTATAYDRYSVNRDATNCRACHGDFRATSYVSLVDGQNWGSLHNLHRSTMLNSDCEACHFSSRFPTFIGSSTGGLGLSPLGCVGCHGRAEDNVAGNPESPHGYGAGLRQHHQNAGVTVCATCHADAVPANYTAVGENVLPPYYANPGSGHPNMPVDPCNLDGSEDFAGAALGLDNDGDLAYDGADGNCAGTPVPEAMSAALVVSNSPNPFNPQTTIRFTVETAGPARISVYSVEGALVKVLHAGNVEAGSHDLRWDGTDTSGRPVTSGLYLCRLETRAGSLSRTMTLVR